tara:strand:+ start:4644 stop:5918 length:1275 start_codon:yes stop_codon:yes gene_type:complete
MFLKSLHLVNYRGFADHQLSFEQASENSNKTKIRKTTILLGNNGTGKSNILKAIGLVLAGRDALPELLGEPESWIRLGQKQCEIHAVIQTKEDEERNLSIQIKKNDEVSDVLDRNRESLSELESALEHTNRSYFTLGYGATRRLNIERRLRSKSSPLRHLRAQNIGSLFSPEAMLTPIESWAMDMDYQGNKGAVSTIKRVMSDFLNGVQFSRIDKKSGSLMFKTPEGEVPMNLLSDGYQNVAAWVGDLLYRTTETFQDYKSPLNTRGVLLIDELEAHLHPNWQKELLAFLESRLPNFQIVTTTHSPVIAQQAKSGELFYLERKGKSLDLHGFVGNPQSLLLHQLIMSDAFGMDSDESFELTKKKARFEKLSQRSALSANLQNEMDGLKEELETGPMRARSNSTVSQEQAVLLQKIQSELEKITS